MRNQIIPDPPAQNRHNDDQKLGKCDSEERFENLKFTGFFQGQVNTSRVAGCYNNTHARVAFEDPLTNQVLEDETGLLNQRVQNYDQVPPPSPKNPTYKDNQSASTPRITKSHYENKETPINAKYHL